MGEEEAASRAFELLGLADASVGRVWKLAAAKDALYQGAGGMGDDRRVAGRFRICSPCRRWVREL